MFNRCRSFNARGIALGIAIFCFIFIGLTGFTEAQQSASDKVNDPATPNPAKVSNDKDSNNSKANEEKLTTAKKHFTAGNNALKEKDFQTAHDQFLAAYKLSMDPVLFFQLGNVSKEAGKCKEAIDYFEKYLEKAKPPEAHRNLAIAKIAECKKTGKPPQAPPTKKDSVIATTDKDKGKDVPPVTANEQGPSKAVPIDFIDTKPSWKKSTAWISVAVTLAFLTTGTVLGLSAESREEDINLLFRVRQQTNAALPYSGTVKNRYQDLRDQGDKLNDYSRLSLAIAGVAAINAAVFFFLDHRDKKAMAEQQAILPLVSDDSVGVQASWTF